MKMSRIPVRTLTRVRKARRQRQLLFESLERRHLLAANLQNPLLNVDVNDDGFVAPIDALVVINRLNAADSTNENTTTEFYVDTSGDDLVTPIDALLVINSLNHQLPVPTIELGLLADSGLSSTDLITNDPRISGSAVTTTPPIELAKIRINRDDVIVLPIETSGNFDFDPRSLPDFIDGLTRIGIAVTLANGRTGIRHIHFTYDATPPTFVLPHLAAADDTGFSNSDNVTKIVNPRLEAAAEEGSHLVVQFDGQVVADLDSTGSWETQLPALADGAHEVSASATDVAGNVIQTGFPVIVTIDTVSPPAAQLDLATSSDTGTKGDHQTGATRVTLLGNTEGNAIVTLEGVEQATRAANDGKFRLTNIALASGANTFTAHVSDLAGNSGPDSETTLSRIVEAGVTDPVVRWDNAALEAIRLDASDPLVATRNLAMMSQAMFDVVNAVEGTPSLVVNLPVPADISPEAAASSAAFEILKYAYPAQETSLLAVLDSALAEIADGPSKIDGVAYGRLIAEAIIALRSDDGWDEFVDYVPNELAGRWQETAPMYAPALQPQWENVRTFVIDSAVALVPRGPPDLTSETYASDFVEVAALGRATGSSRTADQTQIARFWADGPGTVTPPGHWNTIASQVAISEGNSWGENARVFAELNTALGDAAIVAWKAKYTHEFWRPITAIQQADIDENDQTTADPTWSPLLITPPFPEYVSGHSTFSGAAARVLTDEFGSSIAFTIGSTSLPNVQRSFTNFEQAAEEAGRSRVYGGIHYEFSNQDGQSAGRAIADEVLNRFSSADDLLPPKIVFTSPTPGLATNTSPTIQGWVIDNLSGVRELQAADDDGDFAAVSFDTAGRFSIQPQLVLDGSNDGSHVVHFRAMDHAGLASDISDFSNFEFTLDTQSPTVVLASLSAGAQIQAGELLEGTANGTGSLITSLSYQVDAGSVMPLSFDNNTGSFSQPIDFSKVSAGTHTVSVMARDAAGLTTVESVSVELDAAVPFVLGSIHPAAGAIDIGTTIRPQVFFSRAVQASSLTAANFYATGPDGAKLPATIVPAADGTFAWLFFADPMPGGALVTLHVDGATILAAADGLALDANSDGVEGGSFESTFRTVSLAPLLGTSLSGKILDPGPDLSPMTFDDIRAGADQTLHTPDDVFLLPLAGVTVFILGLESQVALTDAAGNFHFDAVPAGNVKLAIDGRTATNAPTGIYFPEMVMDLNLRAGVANTSMGTMGTLDQQLANLDREEVYLPRLRTDILQPISTTEQTVITIDAASAPELTPEQRSRLTITIEPGTAIGHDGQPIVGGEIGISTVPPELVRDMLPPGLLQHTFDITIQAPGIDRFTKPVAMTFPNLMGAEPGTQVNFLSFDHATGRLVIEGTMTVSPDGLTVSTDPNMGITHPGWEGTTPLGSCGGSGGPPALSVPLEDLEVHDPVVLPLISQDVSTADFPALTWFAPPATTIFTPPLFGCTPADRIQGDTLFVTIEVDGPLAAFVKKKAGSLPLQTQSFALPAGSRDTRTFDFEAMTYEEMFGPGGFGKLDLDQLYGSVIRVTQLLVNSDGSSKADLFTYYTYRWVDVVDANAAKARSGLTAAFFKTLADGPGGVVREKLIDVHLPKGQITRFSTAAPFSVAGDGSHGEEYSFWHFDPAFHFDYSQAPQPVLIRVFDPNLQKDVAVGIVLAGGKAIRPTILSVNLDGPPAPDFNDGYQVELKRVLLSLQDVYFPGNDGVPGGPGDDDDNDLPNDDGEWGFLGTFEVPQTVYEFTSVGPLPVTTVGADLRPGKAGVDDDNNGTIDKGLGELGAAGSDDQFALAIPTTNTGKYLKVSKRFADLFAGFMPKDRAAVGPDGIAKTPDDQFTTAQLAALDARIAAEADALLAAIQADFADISQAIVFQRSNAGADVSMAWRDLGNGLFGSADYDSNVPQMRALMGTQGRTDPIQVTTFNLEIPESAQQWALAQYINENLLNTGRFAVGINLGLTNPVTTFAQYVANSVSHELAHTFGLVEGYFYEGTIPGSMDGNQGVRPGGGTAKVRHDGNAPPFDIMSNGQPGDKDLTFKTPTAELLKAATGTMDNADLPLTEALKLWRNAFNLQNGRYSSDGGHDQNGIRDESLNPSTVPEIFVTAGEEIFFGAGDESVAIGTTPADGAGGAFVERSFTLINEGYAPLTLESVALDNAGTAFSIVSTSLAGMILEPGESTTFAIRYDPLAAGEAFGELIIVSNAGTVPEFHLTISGDGIVNQPRAVFQLNDSNNFGGVQVLNASAQVVNLAAITNRGAQPLRITAINIVEGAPAFSLLGVPANLASQPIELAIDNIFEFGIHFDPDTTGLRRAIVEVTTNDPAQPKIRFTAVGTGLTGIPYPQWGDDFVAIVTSELPGSPVLRAESDTAGNFSFFLPSVAFYHLAMFDPVTGLVAHGYGTTGGNSTAFNLTDDLVFLASTDADGDFDGLPDDIEFAAGTAPKKADTDNDGLSDFVEIELGLDPLGGLGAPTGVVAAVSFSGEAHEVVVEGTVADPTALTAYIAAGVEGLSIVDVSIPTAPLLLSSFDLAGVSGDVDVDIERGLAAVAAGFAGLHIVDVANQAAPTLVTTVTLTDTANRVEILSGLAIVASGNSLVAVDLVTHEVRQTIALGAATLTDLVIEGTSIYTMDVGLTLRAVTFEGQTLTPRGSVTMRDAGGKLFVTNGVVYVTAVNPAFAGFGGSGYSTVDVGDPDNLVVLSDADTSVLQQLGKLAVAANGSGLVVLAGEPEIDLQDTRRNELEVLSGVDPTNTAALRTRIPMPGLPRSLALASGFGFVATGLADLQIVSIVQLDTAGLPPSASIAANPTDVNPVAPGVQVLEERSFAVTAQVADDVQVRSVELLVNGQVVHTDLAAPWSLLVTPPLVSAAGSQLTVQVRASDTGGNTTLSNILSFGVIADTIGPTLVATTPNSNERVVMVPVVELFFDEPLDPVLLDAAGVSLVNLGADGLLGTADDVSVGISSLSLRDAGRILSIVPAASLGAGVHRLSVDSDILADSAGNHVVVPVELSFEVAGSNPLIAASGFPTDPELPSANPGQEISFVMPWGPEMARISYPAIFNNGQRYPEPERLAPSRTNPLTRTAYFIVPDNAVTGDFTLFGSANHSINDLPNWTIAKNGVIVLGQDSTGYSAQDPLPGNGLYLDLSSSNVESNPLESKTLFDLVPGDYELRFDLAGSQAPSEHSVTVSLGEEFTEVFSRPQNTPFATFARTITVTDPTTARLVFDHFFGANFGLHLDNVKLTRVDSGAVLLDDHFDLPVPDGTFPLQIVPVVTGVDVTGVDLDGADVAIALCGGGFIEGEDTVYQFGSVEVLDSEANAGPDVNGCLFSFTNENSGAALTVPLSLATYGAISVTTAGGTSAPFTVTVLEIVSTALSGTPADPAVPSANPGQSITINGAGLTMSTDIVVQYTNESGQLKTRLINPTLADLDGTSVQVILPAILNGVVRIGVFGSPTALPVQIVPVIQQDVVIFPPLPAGSITRLIGRGFLEGDSTYDIGGNLVFDADVILGPDVVGENSAVDLGFVVDENTPVTVTTAGGTSAPILVNVPIPLELPNPTITGISSEAADGVPANAAEGSGNTGQVITIQGTNFRLDALQILFPTRDESGVDGVQGVAPLAVNNAGTLAQVRVPDLAATGLLHVTSIGSRNLGFNSTNDAIHRGITVTFTPTGGTVELRFGDGGLTGLSDEAWGLDNVQVTRDAATIFSDDFQGADRPEWSQATTADTPRLTRFSGRFSNSVQTLTLTGVTARVPHTLRFDLYVLDSWDGLSASGGPDRFLVRADAETVFDEAFSNDLSKTQTFAGAEGVLLQIVPTITRNAAGNERGFDYDLGLSIFGTGFIEGAGTITVGGLAIPDNLGRDSFHDPNVLAGTSNKRYEVGPTRFTLDGPIRVTTAGGYFEAPSAANRPLAPASLASIQSTAEEGIPLDPSLPSANSGQEITLHGVFPLFEDVMFQFDGVDDTGRAGTITPFGQRGGADRHGRFMTVDVPELARTGMVRVLGSPGEFFLQIVPTLRSVGPLTPGMETVLEGTGLLPGDLALSVDGQPVASYSVNTVDLEPTRQFVTFTVPAGIGPGVVTVVSSGGTATIRPGVAQATTELTPAADVGDTIGAALLATTVVNGRLTIDSDLEARPDPDGDIDIYEFNLQAGERIVIDLAVSFFDGDFPGAYMQLFNSAGQTLDVERELPDDFEPAEERMEFTATFTGSYFVGVSDVFHNYNPITGEQFSFESPDDGFPTGVYQLHLRRLAADATVLTGITATAFSGAPALAGVPSAHKDQVIVLTGSGLRIDELVGFTHGTGGKYVAMPLSVSADGTSLTVEVPEGSISGAVRLLSDAVGVFLQIVPTLDELNVTRTLVFGERSVNVSGTGLDRPATIQFGSTGFGVLSVFSESVGVDHTGVPLGPISITTPGGTSDTLAGPDLISIVALAASGVPANPSLPSANPGQTITLQGSRFTKFVQFVSPATPLVFQVINADGIRREQIVDPTTANSDGTQMTVVVPNDAVTGLIGVVGDPQGTTIVLQIVPLVTSVAAEATGVVKVMGKGLIEGDALYDFGARKVLDGSTSSAGVDVQGTNDSANVALPTLGSGSLTVTTAGGTSAPLPFGALMSLFPGPDTEIGQLTAGVLDAHVAEAITRFSAAGVSSEQLSGAQNVVWQVSNLPSNYLGLFTRNIILIDSNAAGWGWFIDSSPADDSEFTSPDDQGEEDRMDLLTIVMHELGHLLGLDHDDDGLMADSLTTGVRRTEFQHDHEALVDQFFGQSDN